MDDFRAFTQRFRKSLQNFAKTTLATLWMNGTARLATLFAIFVAAVTVFLNTWVVTHLNRRILPEMTTNVTRITERDVSLGKVKWMLPTGFIGMTSIASVGPIWIGSGSVEKSELKAAEVLVGLDCIRSVLRRELVLNLHCNELEAKLVQADNYSWFGRPVDTSPPSSDFIPGWNKDESPPEVEVGSFMGMTADDRFLKQLGEYLQKLANLRQRNERRMSQYDCSTSTPSSKGGRRVMASLTSDVTGDNREESSETKPSQRTAPPPKVETTAFEGQKRLKLSRKPRETSHGQTFKYRVEEREEKERIKARRPIDRRKKEEKESKMLKETKTELETKETETSVPTDSVPVTSTEEPSPVVEADSVESSEESEKKDESGSPDKEVSMEEVKTWATAAWRQLTKNIKPPDVSVGHLKFDKGTILAYTTKEDIPREFVNVKGNVQLGRGYHTLEIDLETNAHKRNPASTKWTQMSPFAPKHLRFVTPGATRSFDRHFPSDITSESILKEALEIIPPVKTTEISPLDLSTDDENSMIGPPTPFGSLSAGRVQSASAADEDGLYDVNRSPPKVWPPPSRAIREKAPSSTLRTSGRPKGGTLRISLKGKNLFLDEQVPFLKATITGQNLHAPLIERFVEIPMDIQEGRVNGTIHVTSDAPETWRFPRIDGHLKLKDVDMHFWDAPDHISKACGELIMENNRMYFHEASGHFGALNLVISGDMDLDPEKGRYRLSAVIDPVEFNAIRSTFGIRPTPNPFAGALQGTVHCTGPLREPVFTGALTCIQPTPEMIESMENSHAKSALLSLPDAVGAFDKVPFLSGKALFTHDMGTDVMTIHDFVAEPAGGGRIRGAGQLWVAPVAEHDPKAVHIRCEGHGVAAHELMQRYVPQTVEVPKILDCGATHFKMMMKGSHASPITNIQFEAPSTLVTGDVTLSRSEWKATATAPAFDLSGTLYTQFPEFERTKQIYTQTEMSRVCQPKIQGVDSVVTLKGCDMLPLFSNKPSPSRIQSGQALRLKVSGTTQIKAWHIPTEHRDGQPRHFQGDVMLQGLRLNQLNLAKSLTGKLDVSPSGVSLSAKGIRDDELLNFEINLEENVEQQNSEETEDASSSATDERHSFLKGGKFSLKQGRLDVSSQVNSETNRVQMQIRGMTLDELELASLRGELQVLSLDLNFQKREGRGEVQMTTPRYSGLLGEALSGGFRWERDVVRLEKMILQQKASRYEVQGEYTLPSILPSLDRISVATLESGPNWIPDEVLVATAQPYVGRWRVQVNVPQADVQEILPAMRLLSQATGVRETDYEKAREDFLRGLEEGGLKSPPLSEFVKSAGLNKKTDAGEGTSETKSESTTVFPGIQSLKGRWHGTLQAFGGGGGASTLNFNLKGHSWKWGEYELDEAVATGNYHSSEGVHLEEISMRTGEARFSMRGDLFGPKQEASFVLNDFPAALLSPVYKAVPALQNAVPSADHTQGIQRLMDGWERTKTTLGLSDAKSYTPMEKLTKNSPVNGLLFVRGTIGGSNDTPQGLVTLELFDGSIGTTQLSNASARVVLGPNRTVDFRLESTPSESKGLLCIEGKVPLGNGKTIEDLDISVRILDGGMELITAMVPDFKWENGSADIDFRLSGNLEDPQMQGKAKIWRGSLSVPNLKFPLKNMYSSIRVENGILAVDNFESKSGKNGHIKAKGILPILKTVDTPMEEELAVNVSRLELKASSAYNGRLDSRLKIRRSLKEPVISGDIEVSRGIAVLQFGAFQNAPTSTSSSTTHRPIAKQFADLQNSEPSNVSTAVLNIPKQVPIEGIRFEKLRLKLGSELRFQVPFMVNLLLSGGIEISGTPQELTPKGEIYIDSGMVNLFATQLTIDREDSPGIVRFSADQGFDPDLDFTLTSPAEGFKAICKGKASTWQKNVILRFRGVEGTDEENLSQAAKLFQSKLAGALVEENGQLALLNLAASTMATLAPRLDTWGQIGGARWRLVSVPNIPYLLSNTERLDFQDIVTSLLSGTEIEIQYGPTQAVVGHKLHGSTVGMQYNLALNLTDNLKLSAGVENTPSTAASVMLQYSSEGRTRMKFL